jgi:hypothetical protein
MPHSLQQESTPAKLSHAPKKKPRAWEAPDVAKPHLPCDKSPHSAGGGGAQASQAMPLQREPSASWFESLLYVLPPFRR